MSNNFQLTPDFASQLTTLIRQAGRMALNHFNHLEHVFYKADDSFVTQVDLEVEQFLVEQIRAAFPDDGFISEEGTRSQNIPTARRLWIIDPLDGTTAFVRGLPGWGISVGLLVDGQPTAGFFYMPLLDDFTYTVKPDEVWADERDIRNAVKTDWQQKGYLAVSGSTHYNFKINIKRIHTIGGAISSLIYTARGSATAAFIPKARIWDLAAGSVILQRAGGQLRYLSGREIDYPALLDGELAPEPIIASHPTLLKELPGLIEPRS